MGTTQLRTMPIRWMTTVTELTAGIIGAEGGNDIGIAGVNWKVQIMPLKFMNAGGCGTTKDAVEAINYVIDRKKARSTCSDQQAGIHSEVQSTGRCDSHTAGICLWLQVVTPVLNNEPQPHYPSSYIYQT